MSNAMKEAGIPVIEISRDEIRAIKQDIKQTHGGLGEATRILQQPVYRQFARLHPKTRSLYKFWEFLGLFNLACFTVFPIILFVLTRWYWAIAPIVLNVLFVQRIHNSINLELYARVTYLYLKTFDVTQEDIENV